MKAGGWKSLFFGGLLPVIAFSVIEDQYGLWWGLIAGMAFGLGEILYELIRERKVSALTWFGNGMLLALGGVSLLTDEGIWFKLQPAFFEIAFTVLLWASLFRPRNLLLWMMEQQGQSPPDFVQAWTRGLCFRLGIFFALQAGLAVWAALHWSTEAWALLKGIGLTVSLIVYMVFEVLVLRRKHLRDAMKP